MNKKILRLAIPNIISNITVPLLGLVDVGLMGHLGSSVYLGAIAVGSMIFNFIFWIFGFLRMGSSGFTAQAYGNRNFKEVMLIFVRSLIIALVCGIILIILQYPIAKTAFYLSSVSNDILPVLSAYFYIRIYAAPATIALTAILGWLTGMQNAKTPMIIFIAINILNIFYSLIFVIFLDMKAEGVALGSVLAQYSGLLLAIFLINKNYRKILKYFEKDRLFQLRPFVDFLSVNKDIFIRTLLLIITISFFTVSSSKLGNNILAANTLMYQFFIFFSYFMDGFAFAAESLVGKFIGSNNIIMLRKMIKRLFLWGTGFFILFTLIYILLGNSILHLLTNDTETLITVNKYFFWVFLVPFVTFSAFLWDGIYVGAIASKPMRNYMIISVVILFFPSYYLFFSNYGNNGLWAAFLIFLFSRGLLLQLGSKKHIYNKVE